MCTHSYLFLRVQSMNINEDRERIVTVLLINRDRVYRITDVDGAAEALVAAKFVVIVSGYGLGESFFRIHKTIYIFDFLWYYSCFGHVSLTVVLILFHCFVIFILSISIFIVVVTLFIIWTVSIISLYMNIAVAKAQYAVAEIATLLINQGISVSKSHFTARTFMFSTCIAWHNITW